MGGPHPLTTLDKVMIGLNVMAGAHYQRVGALIGGVDQSTVSKLMVDFSKAVNEVIRPEILHLPTPERMRGNEEFLQAGCQTKKSSN